MLDQLTALGLAGPVLQIIRLRHAISSRALSIQALDDSDTKVSDSQVQVDNLRAGVRDANVFVTRLSRLVADGTAAEESVDELQTVKTLSMQCRSACTTTAEQLTRVSESLDLLRRRPFEKKSITSRPDFENHVDFEKVESYIQALRKLAEYVAVGVTESLTHSQAAHFKRTSLKEDILQAGLSTILQLLEHGGADINQDDPTDNTLVQQCTDISTQSRLDTIHSIEAEPPSVPLAYTKLRRKTILELIYFRQMSDRIGEVNIAYEKTLEWIFRDTEYGVAWSSFPDFLKSSSDLPYWINGKAGSGKSTLLRFLVAHEKTLEHLLTWSGARDLQLGHFFSWNLGTTLQKSQTGLLQSLIYQVLKRDQSLIHQVFPDLWHEIDASNPKRQRSLSLKDVKHAFARLVEISAPHKCFCFFVDGVDEFDEDHSHVADTLLSFAAPNLKFVLSSRPVDACLDRFDLCPKLQLQDLTADDIEIYIDGRLSSHHTMLEVMHEEPEPAAELVRELKDRASGVFLWVKLVVTSLLTGLRKGDDVAELKMRLHELPPDLSRLYASMLGKMDPSYSRKAAVLFRLVRTASMLLDGQGMPTQYLAVAGREFKSVLNRKPIAFETAKVVRWCRLLRRQLYSRCCGLVELSSSLYTPDWWHADLNKLSNEDQNLLSSHVQFLHRTVTEYLYQDHVWDAMVSKTVENETFNPYENVAYAALHMMKISPLADDLTTMQAYRWAQTVVRAAREFERETETPLEDLIDEMDLVLRHHVSTTAHWSTLIEVEPAKNTVISHLTVLQRPIQSLFSFSAFVGLSEYVNTKLKRHGFDLRTNDTVQKIMLQALFSRSDDWMKIELADRVAVVSCLLEHGANLNETLEGPSFWQCCLQQLAALKCQGTSRNKPTTHRRRKHRRVYSDAIPGQNDSQCRCSPEVVQNWSELVLYCLNAGAKRGDIDYLAPFSYSTQGSLICCFSQMCQTLYQTKHDDKTYFEKVPSNMNMSVSACLKDRERRGNSYGTNVVTGSANAHLGDEYTYGDKITHVHYNYYDTNKKAVGEVPLRQLPSIDEAKSINCTMTNDYVDMIDRFRKEVKEVLKDSPTPTSKAPDLGSTHDNLTTKERDLVRSYRWRGKITTFTDRRCSNSNCLTSTTGGWEYVPSVKGLLCLDCYHSWQETGLLQNETWGQGPMFTGEELFNQSFAVMSLTTATEDSDQSDDDNELAYNDAQRSNSKSSIELDDVDAEQYDTSVTPRSVSVAVNRPTLSAYDNLYDITSGSAHYLKSYRS